MKYEFIKEVFKSEQKYKNNKANGLVKNFRDNQRKKFMLISLIAICAYYIIQLIMLPLSFSTDFYYFYIVLSAFIIFIGLCFVVWYFQNFKKLQMILKWIIFSIFFCIQVFWFFYVNIVAKEEVRALKHFYILLIFSDFFLVIFLKMNYIFICIISSIIFLLSIFLQVYSKLALQSQNYYIYEIFFSFLMPAACLITRKEYDTLINFIYSHIRLNANFLNYIDRLVDQMPASFFTITNKKIVFVNFTFQEFLRKNVYDPLINGHLMTTDPQQVNIMINQQTDTNNLISGSCEEISNFQKAAKEFLALSKMTFIDPGLNILFEKYLTLPKIEAPKEISYSEDYPRHSLLSLINFIESSKENEEISSSNNKFFHLGMIEFKSQKTDDSYNFQIALRRNTYNNRSWTEVIMHDITLSKKINYMSDVMKVKENLLSKIAHEFKTPLICVVTLAEEINDMIKKISKIKGEFINCMKKVTQITDISNYTLYLINDIVTYLHKEQKASASNNDSMNNLIIHRENCKLSEILQFCHRIMQTLLSFNKDKAKEVKAILDLKADINFFTDPFRLKQIILNLISNAVKFTKRGHISLKTEISTERITLFEDSIDQRHSLLQKRQKYLKIIIEDSGMGIKEEDCNKIFIEERMLDVHKKENHMGSGLGLSISYHIARTLGLKLTCYSQYGVGTTFTLKIPISDYDIINTLNTSKNKNKIKKSSSHKNFKYKNESVKVFREFNSHLSDKVLVKKTHKDELKAIQPKQPRIVVNNPIFNINNSIKNYIFNDGDSSSYRSYSFRDCMSSLTKERDFDINYPTFRKLLQSSTDIRPDDMLNLTSPLISGQKTPKSTKSKVLKSKFSQRKILIIDDNMFMLQNTENAIRRILSSHNINDIEIVTGCDGVDFLKEIIDDQKYRNKIIVSFVDEFMEYINGSVAIGLVRKLEEQGKIKKNYICKLSALLEHVDQTKTDWSANKPVNIVELEGIFKTLEVI
jgi:signal transduction histidine kinase